MKSVRKGDLYTMEEAAEILRMSYDMVWRRVHDGRIAHVMVGKRRLIHQEDLDEYVNGGAK